MIKIENTVTPSAEQWERIIMGARNPMNSWGKSDSGIGCDNMKCADCGLKPDWCGCASKHILGPADHDLLLRLARAGSVDGKFRRMITVYADITAPLYWWKEFDTYKVGTVANSCSTMHKIHAKEFTMEDFSTEHLMQDGDKEIMYGDWVPLHVMEHIIMALNKQRTRYLETKDKKYWWQMIQLLPTSYNQKRTVMLNYEVLAGMYKHRRNHKLDEWHELCAWIETLPYSELITCSVE